MPTVLRMRGVDKRYRAGISGCQAEVAALRDCSFDLRPGELLGILGSAGAGKSTLLLCAAGLLRPDRGTIEWFGSCLPPAPNERAYVAEHASHCRTLTVRETLERAAFRAATRPSGRGPVGQALWGAGLESYADTEVARLPRGAAVRLSIARAMLGRPRLLLLDETLTGLPSGDRREVAEVLRTLARRPSAIVLSSGDGAVLAGLCTRILRLEAGTIRGRVPVVLPGVPPSPLLELEVEAPMRAARQLCDRLGATVVDGRRLLVPLATRSPEEALALCRALDVAVMRSRIVPGFDAGET